MRIGFGFAEGAAVEMTVSQDGRSASARVARWGQAHDVVTGMGGRILASPMPLPGAVRQHDGSYVLPLWDELGASSANVTRPDDAARKVALEIAASAQGGGWGDAGRHYMPERDADGRIVVEPGRNHRKVYVTLGPAGMTATDIAAHAGVAVGDVTAAWLKAHPQYGGSEAMPLLDGTLARALWVALVRDLGADSLPKPQSHWLLFERGYDYSAAAEPLKQVGMRGESALHPMLVGAWGEGARPKLAQFSTAGPAGDMRYIVFRDIALPGVNIIDGGCWILFTECATTAQATIQNHSTTAVSHISWHRSDAIDIYQTAPLSGSVWAGQENRTQGHYVSAVPHVLFEESWWDMIGWRPGYLTTPSPPGDTPQPMSMFSHSVYVQSGDEPPQDICFIGNMVSRCNDGPMMRPGCTSVGTVVVGVNYAGSDRGGDYEGRGPIGYYGLHIGYLATSAGYLTSAAQPVGNAGFDNVGVQTAFDRTIIAHRANPDDPAEIAARPTPNFDFQRTGSIYRAGIASRRWAATDYGLDGLDLAELDQTTIQRHAAAVLGLPGATVDDYLAHLRGLSPRDRVGAMAALREYFQRPFGMFVEPRTAPGSAIFMPSDATEGYRWEIDLNWVGTQPPIDGDEVDLWGNRVRFNRLTQAIASLRFRGALLEVVSGRLTVGAHADDARIAVRNCGQYIGPGGAGVYTAEGGRLALTGPASGDLTVSGEAEALLGPDYTVVAGQTLRIVGGECWAGWDGTGTAALTIGGTLKFAAAAGMIGQLRRFRRRGTDPEPMVAVSLVLATGAIVEVDTAGMPAGVHDLTGNGITVVDQGATLPEGVAVIGGKLVATVG